MKSTTSSFTLLAVVLWCFASLHNPAHLAVNAQFEGGGLRAFGNGLGFGGLGGGFGRRFGMQGPPPGPSFLPEVNSSTTWDEVVWDVLQLALDHCKSSSFCNATGLGLYSEYDSKCSDCHPCACDENCHVRGDCCIDKVMMDTPGLRDQPVLSTAPLETPSLETVTSCRSAYITDTPADSPHYLIITSCPADYTGSARIAERCSASTPLHPTPSPPSTKPKSIFDDFYSFDYFQDDFLDATTTTTTQNPLVLLNSTSTFWPVWRRGSEWVYGNAECALCHGVGGEDLVPWDMRAECQKNVRLRHTPPNTRTVIEDALEEPTCQVNQHRLS
jgi:hypothetical protein